MIRSLLAATALFLVLVPAALAADPGAALTADLQKLTADRATMHATLIGDIQKVTADAKAGLGSTDKASLKATIRADVQKLTADLASNHATMQADRAQAYADYQAAKAAHVKVSQLKSQFQQLAQLAKQDVLDYQQDLVAAQQALATLKASFHK
jgi:hypothetical protein